MLVVFLQQLTILSKPLLAAADISHTQQNAALAQGWLKFEGAGA